MRKLIKTTIKWAPIIYPIVYKLISNKNKSKTPLRTSR
ncbi:hypothetical protein QWT69_12240 [Sporosarcina oncorhynchi]|uniref:Uncharacterized protein n=1 Tax=Sporosarcina oncorhynchi TaxID=3056444 RepID=A0ABZ0LAM5_9BACL|nr:hypothetical protein [Sporosarcina sp. T2O-4]WOV89234.1 hypothetical protein QWT69_12240 [Sporosarcina sp. T2O-4]